jgi:KDO2-lipid IV(A) lauroyltransferase
MKDAIEYYLVALLYRAARMLSFGAASRLGGFLGSFVFRVTGLRKKVTLDNLRMAFPEKTEPERRAIALGAYRSYCKAMIQALWSAGAGEQELISILRVADFTPVRRALAGGRGLFLLSGHFGAWELLASSLRLQVGVPFVLIAQTQRNRRISALVDSIRGRFGNEVVPMGIGTRNVVKALHDKRIIGLLGDQSGPKESVFVDFFGRPAATHRGVAALALKNRTPIVMLLLKREPDETYVTLSEEVDFSDLTEYSEENIRELTQRHVSLLERYIRQFPEQWLWMHRRWKHTPYYEMQTAEAGGGRREESPA